MEDPFNALTVQIVGDTPANCSALRDAIAAAAPAMGFEVVTSGALRFSGAPTMTLRRLLPVMIGIDYGARSPVTFDWQQDREESSRLPWRSCNPPHGKPVTVADFSTAIVSQAEFGIRDVFANIRDAGGEVILPRVMPARPECVFANCPHGHDCFYRGECRHKRADTADETTEKAKA